MSKKDKPMLKRFNLSYSAYSIWKASPLQFYLQYLSDIEPTDKVNNSYGILGNVVHKATEIYIETGKDNFDILWDKANADSLVGFYGRTFDREIYRKYFTVFKDYIDILKIEKGSKFIVEKKIIMNSHKLFGIRLKGYIDLFIERGEYIFILDWKTNARYDYEMHKDQRLFYSYLIKEYTTKPLINSGKIPDLCTWLYAKGGFKGAHSDKFEDSDLIEFEKELKNMLTKITEFGDNIDMYETGDWDNPFNAYKTLCESIEKKREEAMMNV